MSSLNRRFIITCRSHYCFAKCSSYGFTQWSKSKSSRN